MFGGLLLGAAAADQWGLLGALSVLGPVLGVAMFAGWRLGSPDQ
jgi:hypothetical protein